MKFIIGLIVPYGGVIAALPWASSVNAPILGIPFVLLWMFAWFFIVSGCMFACWHLFDRHGESEEKNPQ